MSMLRLDVEELNVETFHPVEPQTPEQTNVLFVVWTGCDSACTECGGTGGMQQFTIIQPIQY